MIAPKEEERPKAITNLDQNSSIRTKTQKRHMIFLTVREGDVQHQVEKKRMWSKW